jgi:hypothetical protein
MQCGGKRGFRGLESLVRFAFVLESGITGTSEPSVNLNSLAVSSVELWLGWPCLRTEVQGTWYKGACFNFLPSFGGAFYTKSARRPRQVPGQFPNRLEVIHKNVSDWFYK